eukprot:144656-Rhodomonas_salina.2
MAGAETGMTSTPPNSSRGAGAMIAEYYDVGGPLTEGAQTDILRGIRRLDERHFAIKVVEKSMSNGAEGY